MTPNLAIAGEESEHMQELAETVRVSPWKWVSRPFLRYDWRS